MHLIPKGFLSLPPSGASLLIPTTRTNSDPCFAVKNQTYAKRCVSRPALKFETYKSLSLHQQYQKIDVLSHRQYQSSGTIFVHLVVGIRCNGRKKRERMKHMTRFGISHQKQKERHNSIGIHLHGYSSDPIQAHKVKELKCLSEKINIK
jgi:hypothetical protein